MFPSLSNTLVGQMSHRAHSRFYSSVQWVRRNHMMLKFTGTTSSTYTKTMHMVTGSQCSHRTSADIILGTV